jgi:hypothetical protein
MIIGYNVSLGNNIVIAGLAIQVISLGLFIATAVLFQIRINKFPTAESYNNSEVPWKKNLNGHYAMSVLLLVRPSFRTEYSMGYNGYPLTHEWTLLYLRQHADVICHCYFLFLLSEQASLSPEDGEADSVNLVSVHAAEDRK